MKQNFGELKPFLSTLIVTLALFLVVFLKMELRSLGYMVLKKVQVYRSLKDNYKLKEISYTKMTSSGRLHRIAKSRLTLTEARQSQIIQISDNNIVTRQ